jgi:hypothetical protein
MNCQPLLWMMVIVPTFFAGSQDIPAQEVEPPKLTAEEAAAVAKINKALNKKYRSDGRSTPLDEYCRDLEKMFSIKIVLDPEELKKAGVAKEAPITLKVKDTPLRIALHKILNALGLAFEVRPNGVFVTAK